MDDRHTLDVTIIFPFYFFDVVFDIDFNFIVCSVGYGDINPGSPTARMTSLLLMIIQVVFVHAFFCIFPYCSDAVY